jgi:Domain of unknown function (DUF4470)
MKVTWQPSWATEQRTPAFMTDEPYSSLTPFEGLKYLWGNVPAVDVLRLQDNEGVEFNKDYRVLFAGMHIISVGIVSAYVSAANMLAASGDLRNVVRSFAGLPMTFQQHCETFINGRDLDVVARNTILLLIALSFDTHAAPEAMIHIWYSALIPRRLFEDIRGRLLPTIVDVCTKVQAKPSNTLLAKTWRFSSLTLRIILRKSQ